MNLLDEKMYFADITDHISTSSFSYTMKFQSLELDLLSDVSSLGENQNFLMTDKNEDESTEEFDTKISINSIKTQKQVKNKIDKIIDDYYTNFFSPRSYAEIRHSYVSKFISNQILPQQYQKKYRHLFIFDWDDTLLCTTYLSNYGYGHIKEGDQQIFDKLDKNVQLILQDSISKGDVFIITNAAKGWVEYSSAKYMPITSETIKKFSIQIISARSQYSQQFPDQIKKWKISAFKSLRSSSNKHLITNIICVGDSHIQMQAGQILASEFQRSLLKTVKFRQNPRIQELLKQQDLVLNKMNEIVNSTKNLNIKLQKKGLNQKK